MIFSMRVADDGLANLSQRGLEAGGLACSAATD